MKILKKPFYLVSTILGSTIALSAIVGLALGIKSYNNSYYMQLNSNPTEHALGSQSSVSREEFVSIVSNLKLNSNFTKISAKAALEAAKSKLYQLDLSSAFDLSALKSKGYKIAFNFDQAKIEGNSIKNVVVYASSAKEQVAYSNLVQLSGFADSDSFDLVSFKIDESKSFLDVASSNLDYSEFESKLNSHFSSLTHKSSFSNLESALTDSGASLSLYNSSNEPVFLDKNFSLEPVLIEKDKNLVFETKDDKLFLKLNLVNKIDKKTTPLSLEIRGLVSPSESISALQEWANSHFGSKVKPVQMLTDALIKDKTTLVDVLYNSKTSPNVDKLIKSPARNLFEFDLDNLTFSSKFGTFNVDKIEPKIVDLSKEEKEKQAKENKVRFEFKIEYSRLGSNLSQSGTIFLDLSAELNKYDLIFGELFEKIATVGPISKGSTTQVKHFSLPNNENSRTLSSDEITHSIDSLLEFAKTNKDSLEDPDNSIVSKVFLLDNSRSPNIKELADAKLALKKVAKEAKQLANSQPKSVSVSALAEPFQSQSPSPQASEESKEPKDDKKNEQTQESQKDQSSPDTQQSEGFGTTLYKSILLTSSLENVELQYKITADDDRPFVFDLLLVSTSDKSILSSTKFGLANVISSKKSAWDTIKKYNPTLFLDAFSLENKDKEGKVEISDPLTKAFSFVTQAGRKTNLGLELRKSLKLQKQIDLNGVGRPSFNKLEDPASRVETGAIYLAFRASNAGDGKRHYLLSDKYGSGLFIQKALLPGDKYPSWVLATDYSQYDFKQGTSPQNPVTSPKISEESQKREFSTYDHNQVLFVGSQLKSQGDSTLSSNNDLKFGDYHNKVWFEQRHIDSKNTNQVELFDQDTDLLLEIIKAQKLVTARLYSKSTQSGTEFYREEGRVDFDIEDQNTDKQSSHSTSTGTPKVFTGNFFDFDWYQIGPVDPNDFSSSSSSNLSDSSQTQDSQESKPSPESTQSDSQKSQDSDQETKPTIILKALAVFSDKFDVSPIAWNAESRKANRRDITKAFIDSYIN